MRRAGRIGRVVLAGRARLAGRSAGRGGRVAGAPYRLTVKILPSARPPQPHWPLQPPGSSRWRDRAPARVSFAYRRAGHSLQYGRDHGPEVSKGGGSGPAVSKEWPAGGARRVMAGVPRGGFGRVPGLAVLVELRAQRGVPEVPQCGSASGSGSARRRTALRARVHGPGRGTGRNRSEARTPRGPRGTPDEHVIAGTGPRVPVARLPPGSHW
jgi:hypothetical protein